MLRKPRPAEGRVQAVPILISVMNPSEVLDQCSQPGNRLPGDLEVYAEVTMRDPDAHAINAAPGDSGLRLRELRAVSENPACGLPDNHQAHDNGTLRLEVSQEDAFVHAVYEDHSASRTLRMSAAGESIS